MAKKHNNVSVFKFFLLPILIVNSLYSEIIKPTFIIETKAIVTDFVIDNKKLYVANQKGSVEVFDLSTQHKIQEISIKPFFIDNEGWKLPIILSVDRYENKTLIVSSSKNGFRDVWIHDGENLKQTITNQKIYIKEARFINKDKYLFGTTSYEMQLYDIKDNYYAYKNHIQDSSFSDLVLSEDKKTYVTASESGEVFKIDLLSGKIIKKYKPLNLDNIYQLDYKNETIITAGQDRRVGVYPKDVEPYYIKSDFLVFSVGLSPNGEIGAYSSSQEHNIQIFDIKTGKKRELLKGHYAMPTNIKFFDSNNLLSSGYENKIFYWKLK